MRRGVTAVVGTVLGTALLIGAKFGPTPSDRLSADQPGAVQPDDSGAPGEIVQPGQSAAAPRTSGPPRPTPTAKTKPSAKPGATGKPSPTAKPTQPGGLRNGTFAGPGVSERFGVIKVTITVSGGQISNVDATCSCSGRSASISDSAFAKLEPRVLSAQNANVQSVSGATYTYTAYKQSLGSAIDSAKA